MSDKLNIRNEMRQFDRKNRKFYDELTDEERKKFSNYLMLRWGSSVKTNGDLGKYYVLSMNQQVNKNFWAFNKHPKLQWLMATSVSPDVGTPRHPWIAPKKKEAGPAGSVKKQLAELFPNMKQDEIELMATITTKKELDQYLKDHGQEKK